MSALLWILGYCAVGLACLGFGIASVIGRGQDLLERPDIPLVALFWPVGLPIALVVIAAIRIGNRARERRKALEAERRETERMLRAEGLDL